MNCSTCQAALPAGQTRCPACTAADVPVEGALAPDLSRRVRAEGEPIREAFGKRRRERTWKDEVRERVDRRREGRAPTDPGGGDEALPLFSERAAADPKPEVPAVSARARRLGRANEARAPRVAPVAPAAGAGPSILDAPDAPRADRHVLGDNPPDLSLVGADDARRLDALSLLGEPPDGELLLRAPAAPAAPVAPVAPAADPGGRGERTFDPRGAPLPVERGRSGSVLPFPDDELALRAPRTTRATPDLALEAPASDDEWSLEGPRATADARPLERPAGPLERAQAALADLGLLAAGAALVVYSAGRVAHVSLVELRAAWPVLAGYLAFLALVYAAYFTGTTGQTPGKILLGLRVVDTAGQAPRYGRAALRALFGSLGVLCAGLGLVSVLFDPARRALHDRLLRTRVIGLGRPPA